ncbi:MAG: NUDIX hydrolase [Cytophagales bacterium]|nr:NUDIX hydrolase [Cytophagales bacterium]
MDSLGQDIVKTFGNKLRLRVSGISIVDNKILLVKHTSIGKSGILYAPPGGGLNYGESVLETLVREMKEETHLDVVPGRFLFVNEYLEKPLHAIELFFEVSIVGGELSKGMDPEMASDRQIIREVGYYSLEQIRSGDPSDFHSIFQEIKEFKDFFSLKGLFSK